VVADHRGAAALPLAARAQQPVPVIGYLSPISPIGIGQTALTGLRQGLRDTGFVEGQNVIVEYRWAEGQLDRLPALAADLVRRQVSVIATTNGLAPAQAAMAATSTIPIVFNTATDPAELGVVASLNRPGGNVTGVTSISVEILGKRLALLLELAPQAKTVAQIIDADWARRRGGMAGRGAGTAGRPRAAHRRTYATYVDRILRGEKPGDPPVQLPTKFEMVVNRKTATALGLAIPPSILLRADAIID
jgi:ABC-type uncharacterized transport system substrate-binding protein